jgi:hypothetical protein
MNAKMQNAEFAVDQRVTAKVSGLGGTVKMVTHTDILVQFDAPANLTLWTRKVDVQAEDARELVNL